MSTQPEFELVQEREHSLRYLSHGADSDLIRWHYHREYELHLIRRTRGKAFIGDYIGPFRPETVFLCGPNLPHNWITTAQWHDDTRDQVINFSEDLMAQLGHLLPEMQALNPMLEASRYGLEFDATVSRELVPAFDRIEQATGMNRLLQFFEVLNRLAQSPYRVLSTRAYDRQADPVLEERINTVVNYIAEHYTGDVSLDEVAALVRLSPAFFSRYFRRATGHRFVDFVTRMRISKACERLELTRDPITNICFEVGFANVANFNRHFLKIKGMTPRQYRDSLALRAGVHRLPIKAGVKKV
ncbi:helix-turn-helix domain-containing protein [Saccharospirillum mangrovi]|uniref:helix-turn-helix domain-containing protein n=1 Tax=Saccharospirillum mangrovi TaxID=2161747 RepID=UPI000D35FCC4|nr:AraC family transcriptional regulator [Saccharospirillum mangrovi]